MNFAVLYFSTGEFIRKSLWTQLAAVTMLIHLLALSNDAVKIIQNFIVSFKSCSAQFEQCFSINSLAGLTEHYAFLLISIKLSQAVPIKFLRVYVCVWLLWWIYRQPFSQCNEIQIEWIKQTWTRRRKKISSTLTRIPSLSLTHSRSLFCKKYLSSSIYVYINKCYLSVRKRRLMMLNARQSKSEKEENEISWLQRRYYAGNRSLKTIRKFRIRPDLNL